MGSNFYVEGIRLLSGKFLFFFFFFFFQISNKLELARISIIIFFFFSLIMSFYHCIFSLISSFPKVDDYLMNLKEFGFSFERKRKEKSLMLQFFI